MICNNHTTVANSCCSCPNIKAIKKLSIFHFLCVYLMSQFYSHRSALQYYRNINITCVPSYLYGSCRKQLDGVEDLFTISYISQLGHTDQGVTVRTENFILKKQANSPLIRSVNRCSWNSSVSRMAIHFQRRMNFIHETIYNPKTPSVCLAYVSSLQNDLVNIIL